MKTDMTLDTEWMKTAMSVSSCNLAKRGRNETPRTPPLPPSMPSENVELLVKMPRTMTTTKTRHGDTTQTEEDEDTVRTESVSPCLSNVRNLGVTPTRHPAHSSPDVTVNGHNDHPTHMSANVTINERYDHPGHSSPDVSINGRYDESTGQTFESHQIDNARVDADLQERSISMGGGPDSTQMENVPSRDTVYNATGEPSDVSGICTSNVQENVNDASDLSGIVIFPSQKKETLGRKVKGVLSTFNKGPEISLSVQQKFYDKWARSKRGRAGIQPEIQSPRKRLEEKQGSRNRKTIPVRTETSQKTTSTPKICDDSPPLSVDIVVQQSDKSDGLCTGALEQSDNAERYSTAEDRRETIDAIINDIKDSLKSLDRDRRGASHSLLQPFDFDEKSEKVKSGSSRYRTCTGDNDTLRRRAPTLGHQRFNTRALVEFENYQRFPWNRHRAFRYPVKADAFSDGGNAKNDIKVIVEKDVVQQTKVPITLSKRTPVLTMDSSPALLDFQNRRIEEHFGKLKTKYNQSTLGDRQVCHSADYPQLTRKITANNTINKCLSQDQLTPKTSIDTASGADRLMSSVTVRYKVTSKGVKRVPRQDWTCALISQDSKPGRQSGKGDENNEPSHKK